jgi:hypothetical protein
VATGRNHLTPISHLMNFRNLARYRSAIAPSHPPSPGPRDFIQLRNTSTKSTSVIRESTASWPGRCRSPARAREIAQIDRLGPAGDGVVGSVLEHCRRRWWLAGRVDCRCRRGSRYGVVDECWPILQQRQRRRSSLLAERSGSRDTGRHRKWCRLFVVFAGLLRARERSLRSTGSGRPVTALSAPF